jgi:hypothetical protein
MGQELGLAILYLLICSCINDSVSSWLYSRALNDWMKVNIKLKRMRKAHVHHHEGKKKKS